MSMRERVESEYEREGGGRERVESVYEREGG